MEGDFIHINEWLQPLSWLYGLGVRFRNQLFNLGILKSKAYDIPIISVGNITVGGTGKTPHVEYLVRLLQDKMRVAVLSRGYKRKSKGYILAGTDTPMTEIGDEPWQMKRKFPAVYVAVDANRQEGIERLTHDVTTRDVDIILLDDAFQHRYVKPGINILLVDYHRLIIYDRLLPAGRLREPQEGKSRADVVIVTKCPKELKPMEYRVLTKALALYPYQDLYFTTIDYGSLKGVFKGDVRSVSDLPAGVHVLLLAGIASPRQIMEDLKPHDLQVTPLTFADHHDYTDKDIERINQTFHTLPTPKIIITTEKDEARLQQVAGLSDEVKDSLYALPITVKFMLGQGDEFNHKILSYVRKNSRNSILATAKDDNKPADSHHSGDWPRTISFRDN